MKRIVFCLYIRKVSITCNSSTALSSENEPSKWCMTKDLLQSSFTLHGVRCVAARHGTAPCVAAFTPDALPCNALHCGAARQRWHRDALRRPDPAWKKQVNLSKSITGYSSSQHASPLYGNSRAIWDDTEPFETLVTHERHADLTHFGDTCIRSLSGQDHKCLKNK